MDAFIADGRDWCCFGLFCAVACGVGAAASYMWLFGARAARARDRWDQLVSNAPLTRTINRQFT